MAGSGHSGIELNEQTLLDQSTDSLSSDQGTFGLTAVIGCFRYHSVGRQAEVFVPGPQL